MHIIARMPNCHPGIESSILIHTQDVEKEKKKSDIQMKVCKIVKYSVTFTGLVKITACGVRPQYIYLDLDPCQQQRNTAKDCPKQQPQQEKGDKAQGALELWVL